MSGTSEGGKKTRDILLKNNPNYYRDLRRKASPPSGSESAGGFDKDPERAGEAGSKGGKASKRGPAKKLPRTIM